MLEPAKRRHSGDASRRCGEERLAGRTSGSRTQAHSCPLGPTGAIGAGAGTSGERVQLGPEQGRSFFGGRGRDDVEIGPSVPGDITTTCSPQPACTGVGASTAPARIARAAPSDRGEHGRCKNALMCVKVFESIGAHSGDWVKSNSSKGGNGLQGQSRSFADPRLATLRRSVAGYDASAKRR